VANHVVEVEEKPKSQEKSKGSTVWVPREFKDRLVALSEKLKKCQWKVLLDALAFYETSLRKPKVKAELPVLDKIIWYVQKLCLSVGRFKERPCDENLARTLKTVSQVSERLGVDCSLLARALEEYLAFFKSGLSNHEKMDEVDLELNMALKSVLLEIFYRHIFQEGSQGLAGSQ